MFDRKLPKLISATRDFVRAERRQPRRPVCFAPELLSVPRRGGDPVRHPLFEDDLIDQEADHLKPFAGVMVAVAISIPMWIIITGLLYYLI
jgi:hypothetical protein